MCGRCPAGKFQDEEGNTACKLCPPGYFCQRGATTAQPCQGGTYANRSGLASARGCTPVVAGYWAPLGSALPQPCPASGFYCPGAAADKSNTPGGSLPIELATGSSSTTEEVEVMEQEMTLDISMEDYNETAIKVNLAALYGVPVELIELGASAGSLLLKITIRTSTSEEGGSNPAALGLSLSQIVDSVNAIDSSAITSSLSMALGTNLSVTVRPPTQKRVTQVAQQIAPAGAWTTAGKIIPCPRGYYNPLPGQTYSGACIPCPQYSTTLNESSTNISQCLCLQGFNKRIIDGEPVCECPAGSEMNDGASCSPCGLGTFKATRGNIKCTSCPVFGSTTAERGADDEALCVCDVGTFRAESVLKNISVAIDMGDAVESSGSFTFTCEPCVNVHETKSIEMTDCSLPGASLDKMPIRPGYWRQSRTSRFVRTCLFAGNASCIGGTNISQQCATGYRGPFCNLCTVGYYGGRGGSCERCDGDPAVAIGAAVGAAVGSLILLAFLLARWKKHFAEVIRDLLEIASTELHSGINEGSAVNFATVFNVLEYVPMHTLNATTHDFSLSPQLEKRS